MFNLSSGLALRALAFGASAVVHVAAFSSGGHAPGYSSKGGASSALVISTIETSLVEMPLDDSEVHPDSHTSPNTGDSKAAGPAKAAAPRHTHDYPVPLDHDDHAHDPSLRHDTIPIHPALAAPYEDRASNASQEEEQAAPANDGAVARSNTVFRLGSVTAAGALPSSGSAAGVAGGSEGVVGGEGRNTGGTAPFSESTVTERARLLSHDAPPYPDEARDADLEADVPLDIVVDARGRVTSARVFSSRGRGFDEAALHSMKTHRFSPARFEGKAVAVRMRWVVSFRLR